MEHHIAVGVKLYVSGVLQQKILKGKLLVVIARIGMLLAVFRIIIQSVVSVVLQIRLVVLKRKLNIRSGNRLGIRGKVYRIALGGKLIMRSGIVVVVGSAVALAVEVFIEIAGTDIFGKLPGLSVVNSGEGSGEVLYVILGAVIIDIEGSAVVSNNCVPFRDDLQVRRSYASDRTELGNAFPILYKYHQTGYAVVGGRVCHFINNIRRRYTVMRQSGFFIVYHSGDRSLVP